MQENLVIVESPAKAKTIEKFLGKDYKVMSSYGHIRDLKKKELSIDLDTLTPDYEIPDEKKKVVSELKKNAKAAKKVWLASDEDREGEAISWHLCEVLGLDEEKTSRIVFHEITKPAILKAIETPRHLDMNLVNAQQARSESQCAKSPPCARPFGGFQAVSRPMAQGEASIERRTRAECRRPTDCRT